MLQQAPPLALLHSRTLLSFVTSADINQVANTVYAASFPGESTAPLASNLEHATAKQLEAHTDLWCLSPPCQ